MDQNKDEIKETQPNSEPIESTSTLIVDPLPIQEPDTTDELIIDSPDQKPSKWSNFLVGLGVLMILGILGAMVLVFSSIGSDPVGQYAVFGVVLLLMPIFGVASLVFVIGTVVAAVKHKSKPSGARRLFSLLSMVAAIPILLYTGAFLLEWFLIIPMQAMEENKEYQENQSQIEAQTKAESELYASEHKEDQISKEKAIELLNSCQVSDFYYTNQTTKEYGQWGEYSATGVALTVDDNYMAPNSLSIADRLIPELVPIAMNLLKNCNELTIWNDGEWFAE